MNRSMSIGDAMHIWREEKTRLQQESDLLTSDEFEMLYALAADPASIPNRTALYQRIVRSPRLLREFSQLKKSVAEVDARTAYLDSGYAMAAASSTSAPQRITTQNGAFTIEIRPRRDDPQQGIITVKVADHLRETFENKSIALYNGESTQLFTGKVINGETSDIIDRIDTLAAQYKVVPLG